MEEPHHITPSAPLPISLSWSLSCNPRLIVSLAHVKLKKKQRMRQNASLKAPDHSFSGTGKCFPLVNIEYQRIHQRSTREFSGFPLLI